MGGRQRSVRGQVLVAALAAMLLTAGLAACRPREWPGGGPPRPLDLTRPRILGAGANMNAVAARLNREPYRTVFLRLANNARAWNAVALDDHTIASERIKARAAKDLAFQYSVNRTVVAGEPAPFPTPAERQQVGDAARTLLLNMYTRSRLAVPPPLGGTDRDINTSEELLQYSTTYDTMLGAGYAFSAADEQVIRTRITDLAAELYDNFRFPEHVSNYTTVLPNNHRSKSAAALGTAALALLQSSPPQGPPPADVRSPAAWLNFALDQIDIVQRWTYVAPDGAYGEGPYYQRYAGQNILPWARAWNQVARGQDWDVGGRRIPDLWTSPWYRQTQRWMLDMTLPNGALAPVDDGNVDFSYYFGTAPVDAKDAAAFAWRWANAPTRFDTDGSIDLAADSLIAYDDAVIPAPPSGSPTRFYAEGGNAVFRSSWDAEATTAVVLGEHGAAMQFGRDRDGLGKVAGAAHEQADTGSFSLHAFGERLLLDPGYMTFPERSLVNKASDHNLILVDGKGPADPFPASLIWNSNLAGLPPIDGEASISGTGDTPFLDTARVTSSYADTKVERRFFFVDDRYVVVADTLQAATGSTPTYTWQFHGNGGGTSGGTFAATPSGGQWLRGAARVDTAVATDAGPVSFSTRESNHEAPGRVLQTHTALDSKSAATGATTHAISIAYPSRSGDAAPTVETLPTTTAGTGIRITDPASDRVVVATLGPGGVVSIQDTHLDGSLRVGYAESANTLGATPRPTVSAPHVGSLGMRVSPTAADLLVVGGSPWVRAERLPFTPDRADGACALVRTANGAVVQPGADGAVTLRAGRGNSAPAADAGPDRDGVAVGTRIRLAGRGCDVDRDRLSARWELVAAPPGSSWSLTGTSGWSPQLTVDAPGPYLARLTVSDGRGGISRQSEVEISGGPRCTGDRLTWNDPRCTAP